MQQKSDCNSTGSAADFVPHTRSLQQLKESAYGCHGCPLYCRATQTVFGEGPKTAKIMLVGEQPGDREDIEGRPFVGPAGRLLDECLSAAGISRETAYVTNAVKHFKWEPRGKRRLHSKPSVREVQACQPWLKAEISAIKPEVIVCLGATAALSLLGSTFRLTKHRREFQKSPLAPKILATVHPSAILRIPDPKDQREARKQLIDDLRLAVGNCV